MIDDARIDPADLRNRRFPGSARKYDARAVDQFLAALANRVETFNDQVDQLERELAEALIEGSAQPAPAPTPDAEPAAAIPQVPSSELSLVDDDTLVRLVGEETASVLVTARRAGEDIRTKAEGAAERLIREATAEANAKVEQAESEAAALHARASAALAEATAAAEAEAERIRAEAQAGCDEAEAEAAALLERVRAEGESAAEAARLEAERIVEEAKAEGRQMVAEAKDVRARVFDDLQRRRDAARAQIQVLLDGRDRLLAAYGTVRTNLEDVERQLGDLDPADDVMDELPEMVMAVVADVTVPEAAPRSTASSLDGPDDTIAVVAAPDEAAEPAGSAEEPAQEPAEESATDEPVADEPVADEGTDASAAFEDQAEADEEVEVEVENQVVVQPEVVVEIDDQVDEEEEPEPVAEDTSGLETAAGADATEVEHVPVTTSSDVDELFARLRAGSESSAEGQGSDAVDDTVAVLATDGASDAAVESIPEAATTEEPAPPIDGVGEVDDALPVFEDHPAFGERAAALAPLEAALGRALKRFLSDEQNAVLDELRRSRVTTIEHLFADASAHVAEYARIARPTLVAAALAGAGPSATTIDFDGDAAALAWDLGTAVVEPFRRRAERAIEDVEGDADELDERLRALYREWKAQHLSPLVADALLGAYARGTLMGAPAGSMLRWMVSVDQGPCPDAEDNALSDPVEVGQAFPTGDLCPQAHPGCRCVVVVER